ncbi:MAG: ATP-dependent zinc metalloprotease FtsH [Treponema sp.]|jgi:cell division protease FtsH|nr:ATP-dependent zinc metalloprotease FtsH [Treponema sp.]
MNSPFGFPDNKEDKKNFQLPKKNQGPKRPGSWKFPLIYLFIFIVLMSAFNYYLTSRSTTVIDFSDFKNKIASGEIKRVEISESAFIGFLNEKNNDEDTVVLPFFSRTRTEPRSEKTYRTVPLSDPDFIRLMDEKKISYYAVSHRGGMIINLILSYVLPIGIFILIWRYLMKRSGLGGNVLSVGQNKAVIVAEGDIPTRFKDVAGVDEAKDELVEVVDFLKSPAKYTEIGGKIPKGVLLVGPPGTGKTLLARAVAGEAGVSFFRMSGADFVEMFVGVGAARVRDLFKQARDKAPCIIFIDELDAIGKSRINNIAGGNDEREQTLNQLLVEMDGFDGTSGLIILAATNRPDVLDPALLRPGRFDRQVLVDRPDMKGREEILKIHSRGVKLAPGTELETVARITSGFSGADLANIVNEAALLAVRAGRKIVHQRDFDEAIEKTVAGLQKKTRVLKPEERKLTAYHEAGHALTAAFTPGADPVQKISIIPRGFALGYTMQLPLEDRYTVTQSDLLGKINILLGGRIAEEMISGEYSTGAANDLVKATDIARKIITDYGMSKRFRHVALTSRGGMPGSERHDPIFQREYSEATQQYIDDEIAHIVEEQYELVTGLLLQKKELLEKVALSLLEKESLDEKEFYTLVHENHNLPLSQSYK